MDRTPAPPSDLVPRLRGLAALADELAAAGLVAEARALAERAERGQLFVACLGQFKRGKSTLVNALVGADVLPTGVLPVTSVVTIVRFGATPRLVIHFSDRPAVDATMADLASYVTEAGNPRNEKGVSAVDAWLPSALLESGLCLVDTPGVGSSSPLATDATRRFVPQVDAALVVLGADPPISGEEVALLRQVRAETAEFIVVINKADRLAETDRADIVRHTTDVMDRQVGLAPVDVFVVSAVERIGTGKATRDWSRLESKLRELAAGGKARVLCERTAIAIERIGRQLVHAVDAAREALEAPLVETERRLAALRVWRGEAERAVADFGVLLGVEAQAAARTITEAAETESGGARVAARAELARRLEADRTVRLGWREASGMAQEVAREAIERELGRLEPRAAEAYAAAASRFVALANALVDRLAQTEPALAGLPPIEEADLGGTPRVAFSYLMTLATRSPWQWLCDWIEPGPFRRRRIVDRAGRYVDRLVELNMHRVRRDLEDRLEESRRTLDAGIRGRLTELVAATERAAARAREVRARGERAVRPELERLAGLRERVQALSASE